MKKLLRNLVLSGVLVAGVSSCTAAGLVNGALVAAQGLFISDTDEVRLGAQTAAKVLSETPEYPNPEIKAYLTGIGQKLAAASERPNLAWQFFAVETTDINAFAAPGGYLFVTTGALRLMSNEAQLAGVMGHEITHVTHHHYREQLAKNATLGVALQGVLAATNAGQGTQLAAGAAFQLAGLTFSRGDESDADKGGTLLLGRVNRNPLGIAKYFERAKSMGVPEWLSDHPGTAIACTRWRSWSTATCALC